MQYKTIALGLLEAQTDLYEQLRKTRQLMPTLETLSAELRSSHIALTEAMEQTQPGDQSQIPAQALEIAVKELEDRLSSAQEAKNDEVFSLDQAMAYIRSPSSRE
jgi:hypothetical protein